MRMLTQSLSFNAHPDLRRMAKRVERAQGAARA